MLEQDFDKLLAAYFEEELDDAGLANLTQGIQETPAYRRRYQRELRLHTLMRETALVVLENDKQTPASPISVVGKIRHFGWLRLAVVAAVLILCAVMTQLAWTRFNESERVGHCLHVSDSDELTLWRNGKSSTVGKDSQLRAGDRIVTGNLAQVSLRLDGVGILTIQGQTEVEIFAPGDKVAAAIIHGTVLIEADKRKPGRPPIIFRTPKAEVEVMGTVFGLEVESTATRVRVHEGLVRYIDSTLDRSVEVGAGQYCVNSGTTLEARNQEDLYPDALMPGQIRLHPVDDGYSENNRYPNNSFLKVENEKRNSYLKFEIPEGGKIVSAKLLITQSTDPGTGTLRFWEGSHQDWSEKTLAANTAPGRVRQIAERKGWVSMNQVIEVDVSSLIHKPGTYTLVITLDEAGSNDIWFGSKESPHPPELILTRQSN